MGIALCHTSTHLHAHVFCACLCSSTTSTVWCSCAVGELGSLLVQAQRPIVVTSAAAPPLTPASALPVTTPTRTTAVTVLALATTRDACAWRLHRRVLACSGRACCVTCAAARSPSAVLTAATALVALRLLPAEDEQAGRQVVQRSKRQAECKHAMELRSLGGSSYK